MKKQITFNPISGEFDYISDYSDEIGSIDSAIDVLFEDDRTPSANTMALNPPATGNYFTLHPLQDDPRYTLAITAVAFIFHEAKNSYAMEQITTLTFAGSFGQPQSAVSIGSYIFVCTTNGSIHTIDWSDRDAPVISASATFSTGQHYDMATNGVDTLFLANTTNNLFIAVNATAPNALTLINNSVLSGFGAGVAYHNGYAYCANYGSGEVHTFEFSGGTWNDIDQTPSSPNSTRLGVSTNLDGEAYLVSNQYAGARYSLHSLSDPANIGASIPVVTPEVVNIYSRALTVDGLMYLNTQLGKVMIYNVRDLTNPILISTYEPTYPDDTKRFSIALGGSIIPNMGLASGGSTYMSLVGTNNVGPQNSTNRDIITLRLPLVDVTDCIRPLNVDKVVGDVDGCYHINTIGVTASLPSSPNSGDTYSIANYSGGDATISGNGNNIMGLATQTIYANESFQLIYSTEWKLI